MRVDGGAEPSEPSNDEQWMRHALNLAAHAGQNGEVPVGAVIVQGDQVLGEGWNQPITQHDPTAHAEVVALRAASAAIGNYRLPSTTLYVTIEPCAMCAGAIVHARIARVVFGAKEPRAGAACSVFSILDHPKLNHRVEWQGGVLADECGTLITEFFRRKRQK